MVDIQYATAESENRKGKKISRKKEEDEETAGRT